MISHYPHDKLEIANSPPHRTRLRAQSPKRVFGKQNYRAITLTLLIALFCDGRSMSAAPPSDPPPVTGPQATDKFDAEQGARLQQGLALATSGNPAAAISQFYDPVIALYEATYADKRWRYFSARSTTEAMLYAVQGAADNVGTKVVSKNWVEAHFMKGYALVDLQQLDAARVEYEAALKLAPHNSQVLAELGSLYNKKKDFARALQTYHQAEDDSAYSPSAAKDVDRAHALRGQGYAYTELKQWDAAEKMYRESLTLDEDDRLALQEIQYIQKQRGAQGNSPAQ